MIQFLRKIRRSLINSGSMRMPASPAARYTFYAIGEIVLVVLGILIALSINNWNTNRQLKNDNKLFLEKMITDLDQNKVRMKKLAFKTRYNGKFPSYQQAVALCDSILKLTIKGLNLSDFEFIVNSKFDAAGPNLNLQKSTYEELLNTGKLYTIGSDSLVKAITNYFKLCESEEIYNHYNSAEVVIGYNSMDKGLGIMIQDYQMDKSNFNINNYPWFFDKVSEQYLNIRIGINKMFKYQKLNLYKMNLIEQQTDTLINIIQKSIDK
jgi:hypothetical protein